ncbi:MAG: FtsX-like permease family protein [Balneolaceae bacterium]|nr:FtsX-like permease family protein [Balneolaceae bacterium]
MAAIIVGIAAMVAITSFRQNLTKSVNAQAKELLGADLEVTSHRPFEPELREVLDSLGGQESTVLRFPSMAYYPETGATRLSRIRAFEGDFPFYGEFETIPEQAEKRLQDETAALVDQSFMSQYQISTGDSVKIGTVTYVIAGALVKVPGENPGSSFLGPAIYIPKRTAENTGLLQRGSQIDYVSYFKFPENTDMKAMEDQLGDLQETMNFGFDTVRERQEEVAEAITYLSNFLNMIGFIALLLGGIGVASSIFVYIRHKVNTVAVLRCVGVSSNQAMLIYLIQAASMGFLGSLMGAILGSVIQVYLPALVQDFFPVDIEMFVSWSSIAFGILTGLLISILFALIPLLAVRKISPLYTLRTAAVNLTKLLPNSTKGILALLVCVFITSYAWLMLGEFLPALFFTLGLGFCLVVLTAFAKLIMKLSRSFTKTGLKYEWRQGLANLYRPNNQTTTLLLTFGLGVTMISAIFLTQDMILNQIDFGDQDGLPNIALFDVQYDQNEGVNQIIRKNGFKIVQNAPIVTMRLEAINSRDISEILIDTSRTQRRWALSREYRSTYRDTLLENETLTEGKWIGSIKGLDQAVPVSVENAIMEDLDLSLGDTLTWDVQGIPIQSYIASTREADWDQPQPNFFVVFPKGVLEAAPQFFATTIIVPSQEASMALQREIVQAYPNVSAIDIGQIINSVKELIGKITFVIQFIGFFSIITGLIVLAGTTATSRFQRIRETVLLRTLGAQKKQVVKIQVIEYVLLGIMASLTGLILSVGTSVAIGYFYFEIEFIPDFIIIGAEIAILTLLVLIIGLINTRGIHHKPPLEVLRAEVS